MHCGFASYGRSINALLIGNGQGVNFWYDSWLPDIGPLVDYVSKDFGATVSHTTLVGMADATGVWRWDVLQQLLPTYILLCIAAVKGPCSALVVFNNPMEDRGSILEQSRHLKDISVRACSMSRLSSQVVFGREGCVGFWLKRIVWMLGVFSEGVLMLLVEGVDFDIHLFDNPPSYVIHVLQADEGYSS
ncbi:hypothetical protein V6N13_022043 [Hibiscus sabdariffa]